MAISGTREWSSKSVNCVTGCSHNCRYCYAKYDAITRFKKATADSWPHEIIRDDMIKKGWGKSKGTIMFPTQHDITPPVLDACITVLRKMLIVGNKVLVVTKPHIKCVTRMVTDLREYKDQILFRFTIGASDDNILSYWEPGAPDFAERLESLKTAYAHGYMTSISMEPNLDPPNTAQNFNIFKSYVSDSIWIGCLNKGGMRVEIQTEEDRKQLDRILEWQDAVHMGRIYNQLKDEPLVRWKESYKTMLGLQLPTQAGLDI